MRPTTGGKPGFTLADFLDFGAFLLAVAAVGAWGWL